MPADLEQLRIDEVIQRAKRRKEAKLVTDEELLQRFWGNDRELDSTDKFLRNYILLEGWKDKFKGVGPQQQRIDEEDEEREEEMEGFEQ